MQTVSVRTTQNVFIEYPIASIGDRILASLIDGFIIVAYWGIVGYILAEVAEIESTTTNMLILTLPYLLYHLLFEIFMNGQSPGKRQMKIKVVSLQGASPSIGSFALRWLFRLFEVALLRGATAIITIGANGKGQRLGDIAADTTVVKLTPIESSSSIFTVPDDSYEPTFTQAKELSDPDIDLIQHVLDVNKLTGNAVPADLLSNKIKMQMGIESDLPSIKFLYTLVKDHSHLLHRID